MEQENQTVEWKELWRDEYLGWICGYANAKGGVLYIGKNDAGTLVGVKNGKKLLEDLPNKVRDVLGIMVDVELKSEAELDYIQITVDPYPSPVNYKGEYHYRTGSTKQVLKGPALNKFLLEREGKKWDALPVPGVIADDLDPAAFEQFRKSAARTARIDAQDLAGDNAQLLDSLHLYEKSLLKRAAVLLFHSRPEHFFTGAYIKIGFFRTDIDLAFQDEVKGSLFRQVEATVDLLKTKYFQASISYQNLNRVEAYPYPDKALREALLNAIAHKDYSSGNPIQISVYPHKLQIWNDGQIPVEWTLEKFLGKHPSKPMNPDIANTFFRAGLIEAWGRGIQLIVTECEKNGSPKPIFNFDFEGLRVELLSKVETPEKWTAVPDIPLLAMVLRNEDIDTKIEGFEEEEINELVSIARAFEPKSLTILLFLFEKAPASRKELMANAQLSNQTYNVKRYLTPLLEANIVMPFIKDKPQSTLQQYMLTTKGRKLAQLLKDALTDTNTRLS